VFQAKENTANLRMKDMLFGQWQKTWCDCITGHMAKTQDPKGEENLRDLLKNRKRSTSRLYIVTLLI